MDVPNATHQYRKTLWLMISRRMESGRAARRFTGKGIDYA